VVDRTAVALNTWAPPVSAGKMTLAPAAGMTTGPAGQAYS